MSYPKKRATSVVTDGLKQLDGKKSVSNKPLVDLFNYTNPLELITSLAEIYFKTSATYASNLVNGEKQSVSHTDLLHLRLIINTLKESIGEDACLANPYSAENKVYLCEKTTSKCGKRKIMYYEDPDPAQPKEEYIRNLLINDIKRLEKERDCMHYETGRLKGEVLWLKEELRDQRKLSITTYG